MSPAARHLLLLASLVNGNPGFPSYRAIVVILARRLIAGESSIDVDALHFEFGLVI